jgi:chaperonin GroES
MEETIMAVNLKPLADRVIVRPLEAEEKTAGGLYIPDTAKEKPQQGEIVAVGPGKVGDDGKNIPMEVKVGDKVLYGKYSGTEVNSGEEDLLIMRENDIFAIIG